MIHGPRDQNRGGMRVRIIAAGLLGAILSLSLTPAPALLERLRRRSTVTFDGYGVTICYRESGPCPLVTLHRGLDGDELIVHLSGN